MDLGHAHIDEVVDTALTIAPGADDRVRTIARQWAYIAQKEIGVTKANVKLSEYIPVIDYSVSKPKDFYKAIDIALYNGSYKELKWTFQTERSTRMHPDLSGHRSTIDVSEDNNYFHVSSNATTAKWMKVKYFALQVDDDGLPMIPENNVNATMHYIRYMYSQRAQEPIGAIQTHYDRWIRTAAQARGKNNTPSMLEGKQIAQEFNSMIQKSIDKIKYNF